MIIVNLPKLAIFVDSAEYFDCGESGKTGDSGKIGNSDELAKLAILVNLVN